MNVIKTKLKDCVIIEPKVFGDERGFFLETFQADRYADLAGITCPLSRIITRAHQKVYCVGCTFKKLNLRENWLGWFEVRFMMLLWIFAQGSRNIWSMGSGNPFRENKTQFWVPPGFAHGFVVLSETADFEYKCTDYYDPSDEGSLLWNDPDLNIPWPIDNPKLSEKDANAPLLADLKK